MLQEIVSSVGKAVHPAAAPDVLIEDAGKFAQNLCWDDRDESLWWSDVAGGRLHRFNTETRMQSIAYEGPPVGAFLPQEDGNWLLFREKDIAVLDFDRHAQVAPLVENVRVDGDRFNEVVADGGSLAKVLGGTGESGGMGWNGRGDTLYWTCGTTKTINRCRYDRRNGAISNRQVFHECMPDEGTPAGLAIDVEGTLWSARRDVGAILKIGANRRLMGQISFPALHVTSVAFGGHDHRTVFAATVTADGASKIFSFQSAVAGMPLRRARIDARVRPPAS
jgi:D-xylonolactonase